MTDQTRAALARVRQEVGKAVVGQDGAVEALEDIKAKDISVLETQEKVQESHDHIVGRI